VLTVLNVRLTFAGQPYRLGPAVRVLKNKKKGGLAMRAMLEVSTDYGYDVAIYEGDLEGITASELWKLRISRPVLKKVLRRRGHADAGQDRERPGTPLRLSNLRLQTMGGPLGAVSGAE
jgi:hypothetical protein